MFGKQSVLVPRHYFVAIGCLAAALARSAIVWATPVVPGLVLWTRADNGVTISGTAVTTWADQTDPSSNTTANNATQAVAANRPTLMTNDRNGLPTIDFDGAASGNGDYLLFNSPTPPIVPLNNTGSGITIFAVARSDASDNEIVGLRGAGNPLIQLDKSINNPRFIVRDSNNVAASSISTATVAVGDWGIYGGTFSRAAASGFTGTYTSKVYYQGATNAPASTPTGNGNLSYTDQQIGGTKNDPNPAIPTLIGTEWDGRIGEVLIFSGVLSSSQRILVENNLSSKYDIGLDTANGAKDRYFGDTGAKGEYDYNLIGIGRDIGAANNVSSSPDNRQGLLLSELNSSLNNDNEWLLAGEKTATNALVNTLLPSGVDQRWQRVWYLEKTGALDAALTFDFSESGLALSGTSYALIFSSTDASTFSVLSNTYSQSGDRISFNVLDASLQNGYYTLALVPEPSSFAMLVLFSIVFPALVRKLRVVTYQSHS